MTRLGRALSSSPIAAVVLAIVLSLAATVASQAQRRVALVIGNGAYAALPSLVNPTTDASDVAAVLASLGFEVRTALDADEAATRAALDAFETAIADADVALFYYAGHGLQLEQKNFLVPVDAVLASEADVYARTFAFDGIVARMAKAPGVKLVILDACQNNPLPASTGPREAGLARVGTTEDFLITFATQPGMVAYDGVGRNSPFTDALLNHLPRQGIEVLPMLAAVNADVNAATGGRQTPYVQFSVKPEFYFAPGAVVEDTPDLQLWRVAARAEDAALLEIYLSRFPEGPYAADARALLDRIGPATAATTPASDPEAIGDTLWRLGRTARSHALVELYVTRYPEGPHAAEARSLLETLTPEDDPDAPAAARCARLATHPRDATAGVPGVSMDTLARNAMTAIDACRRAVAAHPDLPHFTALLARAEAARGNTPEAVRLFEDAAARGDGRALVSLGLMTQAGDGVKQDASAATDLFRRAAERGFVDGKINFAVALMEGRGITPDRERGLALMREAADAGSPIALFNLAALTERGVAGEPAAALDLFRKSAEQGYPGGWRAAAVLLDEGRGVPKDPAAAAESLLRGATADSGEIVGELTARTGSWSPETISAVQERLAAAGYYDGTIDGRAGPKFAAALRQWRLLGPPA